MKRTREDVVEIICIALIVAAFCLPTQGMRLVQWQLSKPGVMFLRAPNTPSINLTFRPWNR